MDHPPSVSLGSQLNSSFIAMHRQLFAVPRECDLPPGQITGLRKQNHMSNQLRKFPVSQAVRLQGSICKSINRHRPSAIFVFIVHDEGSEAIMAGVHENAVAIVRGLGRRLSSEYQAINERLQQDHPRLDDVPREAIDRELGATTGDRKLDETTRVH